MYFHAFPQEFPRRYSKALFRATQYVLRKSFGKRFFEQPLLSTPANLVRKRQAAGELHNTIIEEWRTNFKRMVHADPVNFGQNIFGEISLQVGEHHALHLPKFLKAKTANHVVI